MGIRTNANTDWVSRTQDIGAAGHINFALGGWFRFADWTDQFVKALFGAGHSSNGRTVYCGTNNDFPDPQLYVGDSQTGITGTPLSPRPTVTDWVYIELSSSNATGGTLTVRYSVLGSDTIYTATRTNGIEASVQAQVVHINRAQVGSTTGFTTQVDCAYFRGYNVATADDAAFLTHKADTAGTGALFFWPLADNTDTSDSTGNSRTATFNGTIDSTDSPTLGGDATAEPAGFDYEAEFGAPALSLSLAPSGFDYVATFGSPSINPPAPTGGLRAYAYIA